MEILTPQELETFTRLQKWLNDPYALPVLQSVARAVLNWAKGDSRIFEVLKIERNDPDPELGVVSFVLEFLFDENRLENCRTQLVDHLEEGKWKDFRAILISRIMSYCKDERRKEAISPFHYQYRQMVAAISKDAGIRRVYNQKMGGTFYAVGKGPDFPLLLAGVLSNDSYHGWPPPGYLLEELKNTKVRIAISRKFWSHAVGILPRKYFLPVKDLIYYMNKTYGFLGMIRSESHPSSDEKNLPSALEKHHTWQQHDTLNIHDSQQPTVVQGLLAEELENAAIRFVESWTPNMRTTFYLHSLCGETLKVTADILGFNSPQAVTHHAHKSERVLVEFFRQWQIEGYEGEPSTREEQKTVLDTLVAYILKNHPECRDYDAEVQ